MNAAAKLGAFAVGDFDDADFVAVFFAKDGHSAHFLGLVDGHVGVLVDGECARDDVVDAVFDLRHFVGGEGAREGEVEAEAIGADERTGLEDVVADDAAQSRL